MHHPCLSTQSFGTVSIRGWGGDDVHTVQPDSFSTDDAFSTHWVGAKVHVTLCVDLYSGHILVFPMTLMTVCVLSSV